MTDARVVIGKAMEAANAASANPYKPELAQSVIGACSFAMGVALGEISRLEEQLIAARARKRQVGYE